MAFLATGEAFDGDLDGERFGPGDLRTACIAATFLGVARDLETERERARLTGDLAGDLADLREGVFDFFRGVVLRDGVLPDFFTGLRAPVDLARAILMLF